MDTTKKTPILYDSIEAARFVTGIKGWVDRYNKYFGDTSEAEDMARYSGCTHRKCVNCGTPHSKAYSICDGCRLKKEIERYGQRETKDWDGEFPLYSEASDTYFNAMDEIYDYMETYNQTIDSLRLLICRRFEYRQLEVDYIFDDYGDDIPDDIYTAIDEFNEKISKIKSNVFLPTRFAAIGVC